MRRWFPALALICVAGICAYLLWQKPRKSGSRTPALAQQTHTNITAAPAAPQLPPSLPSTRPTTGSPAPAAENISAPAAAPLASQTPAAVDHFVEPSATAQKESDQLSPATVLENVRVALRDYGSVFGGNPVGTNPEITRSLDGGNPKQTRFLRPGSGMRINGKGELVDVWGTPYFFHQLSASQTEIRSAGPDKIMWTQDDLVIK
jgi:hypothetical protein